MWTKTVALLLALSLAACTGSKSNGGNPQPPVDKNQLMGSWEISEVEFPDGQKRLIRDMTNSGYRFQIIVRKDDINFIYMYNGQPQASALTYTIDQQVIRTNKSEFFKVPDYEVVFVDPTTLKLRNTNPSPQETKGSVIVFRKITDSQLLVAVNNNSPATPSTLTPVPSPAPHVEALPAPVATPDDTAETLSPETQLRSLDFKTVQIRILSQIKLNDALRSYSPLFQKGAQITEKYKMDLRPRLKIDFVGGTSYTIRQTSGTKFKNAHKDDAMASVILTKKHDEMESAPQVIKGEILKIEKIEPSEDGKALIMSFEGKNFGLQLNENLTEVSGFRSALKGVLEIENVH